MTDLYERLSATAKVIAEKTGVERHDVALVLGSGLNDYPATLDDAITVGYEELPGFPLPTVVGHTGTVYSVQMGGNRVLMMAGRGHAYEGHPMDTITFPVRSAILAGCHTVVLTNASGGCGDGLEPGDLVALTDHVNVAGVSPLTGPNDERLGPRFPDMTDAYDPALRQLAQQAAGRAGVSLKEGVYFWFRGPMFETPAEVEMAKRLGADLVGMSTVPEATAARHMGAQVLGISLCTNLAAGVADQPITSEEVMETAAVAADRFQALMNDLLPTIPPAAD